MSILTQTILSYSIILFFLNLSHSAFAMENYKKRKCSESFLPSDGEDIFDDHTLNMDAVLMEWFQELDCKALAQSNEALENNELIYLSTTHDTKSVSYISFSINYIYRIYVPEKHRRQGFGRNLLQQACLVLSDRQSQIVSLCVLNKADNKAALGLYTSEGFKENPDNTMTLDIKAWIKSKLDPAQKVVLVLLFIKKYSQHPVFAKVDNAIIREIAMTAIPKLFRSRLWKESHI